MKNKEIGCFTNYSPESEIYKEFAGWNLSDCKELLNRLNSKIYDQPELKTLVTAIWCYIRQICSFQAPSSNVIIKGPLKSGKTSIYRIVKDYFREAIPDMPVIRISAYDLGMIFDGEGALEELLTPLFYCESSEPAAILFIDEADLCLDAFGYKLTNVQVLSKIVSLLRDKTIFINNTEGQKIIRTDNVMFIYTGEFEDEDIETNDLKRELMNYFPFVMEIHKICEDSISKVINDKIQGISALTGMEINISEKYVKKLVSDIKKTRDWKRILRQLEANVMKIYAELLFTDAMSDKYTISITLDEETTFCIKENN